MAQRIALKTALVTGILALLLAGTAAAAPKIVVQNGNDSGSGSLRKAIEEVDPGGTIVIPASVGEISLTSGQLEIFNSMTIEGAGPGQTTISAGRHSRVIIIKGSPTVTIEGVQIAEGKLDFPGQGVAGAGVDQTGGNVTVADSLIDENEIETGSTGFPYGAGIASSGATSLTLRDTVVSDNRMHGLHNWGAGVNVEGANLTIEGGSIKGNTSEGLSMFGGGLYFDGTKASLSQVAITGNEIRPIGNVMIQGQGAGMEIVSGTDDTIEGATIARNRAFMNEPTAEEHIGLYGGGALIGGTGTAIINTTIADNSITENVKEGVALGGGLDTSGTATIVNSTLVGNAVDGEGTTLTTEGGNLYAAGRVEAENSLFAAGTVRGGGQNCAIPHPGGELISLGHNIDSLTQCDFNGPGDQAETDPKVGPLAENGGPVETVALQQGSSAIEEAGAAGCPVTDARGVLRPAGAACDIGAFEVATPSATTEAASGVSMNSATLAGAATNPDLAPGSVSFEYGPTTAYGSKTAAKPIEATTRGGRSTAAVAGLTADRTYHFRVLVTNATGTAFGADQAFTTMPAPAGPKGDHEHPHLTFKHIGGLQFKVHCITVPCRGRLVASTRSGRRAVTFAHANLRLGTSATEKVTLKLTRIGKQLSALPGKLSVIVIATLGGDEPRVPKPLRLNLS